MVTFNFDNFCSLFWSDVLTLCSRTFHGVNIVDFKPRIFAMYATALPSLPSVTAASIKDGCWNLTICFNVSKKVLGNGRLNLPIKQQNTPQDAPRILNEGELNPELCSLMYNLIPKWLSNLISFDDSYRSIPISTSRITFSTLLNSSTSFFDQTASGFTYRSSVVGLYYDVIFDLLPTEETLRSTLEKV